MIFEYGCDYIKRLKQETGAKNVDDVLALSKQGDPFYVGQKAHIQHAEWFREKFNAFVAHMEAHNERSTPHLRAIHYWLVTQPTIILRDDGRLYENDTASWHYLGAASRAARYLGYVDAERFIDQRNPAPIENVATDPPVYGCEVSSWMDLPKITVQDASFQLPQLSKYVESGESSDPELRAQPYHIEVWCEKSTMNDVLMPVCERYGVNYVTGKGTMSITSVLDLIKRVEMTEKPARVLYISDFDPTGDSMPRQVARQIEFWLTVRESDAEIKLEPVALTHEQVRRYGLPQKFIPRKEDAKRGEQYKERWEDTYGGATELDALHAIYPGELQGIVTEWIERFYDSDLRERYVEYADDVETLCDAENSEIDDRYEERLSRLESAVSDVVDGFNDEIAALQERFDDALAPYKRDLESLYEEVDGYADNAVEDLDIPPPPESEIAPDDGDMLFDSARDYLEQLDVYKERESPHRANVYNKKSVNRG
ncbi:MAG: hypothetical protein WBZ42_10860 [Halobacteriota archaeon]